VLVELSGIDAVSGRGERHGVSEQGRSRHPIP
jgi:hypothetical protein